MPDASNAVLSALTELAWPVTALALALLFRRPLQALLPRVRSFSVAGISAELDEVIERSTDVLDLHDDDSIRSLHTQRPMIEVFTRLAKTDAHPALNARLDSLAREYDTLRCALPRTDHRTGELERVASRMRLLSSVALERLEELTTSSSAGQRLAATVALQASPDHRYLHWLFERFSQERAFIAYHAALALRSAVRSLPNPASLLPAIRRVREGTRPATDRHRLLLEVEREAKGRGDDADSVAA